jgi:hypothetical protein
MRIHDGVRGTGIILGVIGSRAKDVERHHKKKTINPTAAGRVTPHGWAAGLWVIMGRTETIHINIPLMKQIILSCIAVVALAFVSGCASDATHSSTTTSSSTITPGPTTTTTTDTQTK